MKPKMRMFEILLLVTILTMVFAGATSALKLDASGDGLSTGPYVLWFPYVDNTPAPGYDTFFSGIVVTALFNGTTVFIDSNYNCVLDPGEANRTIDAGETCRLRNPPAEKAVKLVSDKPVQAYYLYRSEDFQAYDDNYYEYSPAIPGYRFVVPFDEGKVYVSATKNCTIVVVVDGIRIEFIRLNKGEVYSVPAKSGMVVIGSRPICVAVIENDKKAKDKSFATPLLPTYAYGKKFWIPGKLEIKYRIIDDNRTVYLTYINGSVKKIKSSSTPMAIVTDEPAMAYYLFDVRAKDPWDGVRRYMHAYPILPVYPISGTEYITAGAIISTHDNNTVLIDYDYDGTFDNNTVLNAGEEYNPPVRRAPPHERLYTPTIGHVKSEHPVLVRYVYIDNWLGIDEKTAARTVYWILRIIF